ncbi:MAG: GNAT family N-acetyltransferase [Chloroflexaceae bacterium]|jgi:GNAT superfamily N-acetyltransferase|nr:GNAT family N-acetyltransferase [Chloroflexaceae bacterium]
MPTTQRPFDLADDLTAALALADGSGLNIPHVADWPFRFASWGAANPANSQVWLDSASNMVGWVVLQTPFWAIDCIVGKHAPAGLYQEMLAWAKARATELLARGEGRPMWFLSIDAARRQQRRELEAAGFVDISDVGEDSWSKVLFEHGDASKLEPVSLPEGLTIRSLNPASEIQQYVAMHREVFDSENMTADWRTRSTRMPGYNNVLDLVLASEDGELQGFCVGWLQHLASGEVVGQIEPLGVRESQRGQRLSRQLLTEAIRHMQELGARRIVVEADRENSEAMASYQAAGFHVAHEVLVYKLALAEE